MNLRIQCIGDLADLMYNMLLQPSEADQMKITEWLNNNGIEIHEYERRNHKSIELLIEMTIISILTGLFLQILSGESFLPMVKTASIQECHKKVIAKIYVILLVENKVAIFNIGVV